jgi:hypothetical protein
MEVSAFADPSRYPCKGSGATVGDNHRAPLAIGEITTYKN